MYEINKKPNTVYEIKNVYKIITNKKTRNDKIYYTYTSYFPQQLLNFLETEVIYFYKSKNQIYLSSDTPPTEKYLTVVPREKKLKNRYIKIITLNRQFFGLEGIETDKHFEISLNLNEHDNYFEENYLIKINILTD